MKEIIHKLIIAILIITTVGCSHQAIQLDSDKLEVVNRKITSISTDKTSISLNRQKGDGLVILNDISFDQGTIEVELKGENNPGKSFIGIAFNIENDSTYEAVYFRPFNFRSEDKARRDHSMQYIYHPEHKWRFLRTNNEGQYESDYSRQPDPDDWFGVRIVINDTTVTAIDADTKETLLSVKRLNTQSSDRIGMWTGFYSKGEFRNIKIVK